MRVFLFFFCSSLVILNAESAFAQKEAVTITPAVVVAGSPELIRVDGGYSKIEGSWFGHPLQFFKGPNGRSWYALAGVDVEAALGSSKLEVTGFKGTAAVKTDLTRTVEIHRAAYRTEKINVPPKFIEPGPEAKPLIDAADAAKKKAYASSADRPLWTGNFAVPVGAKSTDSFGVRRMYNGKVAGVHRGMDFRAASGTVVKSGNAGVVVLAQPLYFEGNCVIVDHGLGLMSVYMHFSRIDVKPGQRVAKGDRLGLSGATGRVTGPHLHWAIRWDGSALDPAKVLQLPLDGLGNRD